ncbi:hypothetical protein IK112_02295 [Candidatus Saccharibacteria bacterium]|nr:hypothetical protein [Candidatus Saccharibacteria bacterium]
MELATWILVIILSVTLLVFLVIGIILQIKLIKITNSAKEIVSKGQDIADKTDDVVENIKGMTSVGGLVKNFVDRYNNDKAKKTKNTNK